MKHISFSFLLVLSALAGLSQQNTAYTDSLQVFRNNYINTHEVVTAKDDRAQLRFFLIDPAYEVKCKFEKIDNAPWVSVATSTSARQLMRQYGRLTFTLHDTTLHLYVYQMQSLLDKLSDYLWLPFTDLTSGNETYAAGRYLDCDINDIRDSTLIIDFNKAYNPYCAYVAGYSCPIPPKENDLPVAIRSGEKKYGKNAH